MMSIRAFLNIYIFGLGLEILVSGIKRIEPLVCVSLQSIISGVVKSMEKLK